MSSDSEDWDLLSVGSVVKATPLEHCSENTSPVHKVDGIPKGKRARSHHPSMLRACPINANHITNQNHMEYVPSVPPPSCPMNLAWETLCAPVDVSEVKISSIRKKAILEKLHSMCSGKADSPYLYQTGPSGVGKHTFLRQFAEQKHLQYTSIDAPVTFLNIAIDKTFLNQLHMLTQTEGKFLVLNIILDENDTYHSLLDQLLSSIQNIQKYSLSPIVICITRFSEEQPYGTVWTRLGKDCIHLHRTTEKLQTDALKLVIDKATKGIRTWISEHGRHNPWVAYMNVESVHLIVHGRCQGVLHLRDVYDRILQLKIHDISTAIHILQGLVTSHWNHSVALYHHSRQPKYTSTPNVPIATEIRTSNRELYTELSDSEPDSDSEFTHSMDVSDIPELDGHYLAMYQRMCKNDKTSIKMNEEQEELVVEEEFLQACGSMCPDDSLSLFHSLARAFVSALPVDDLHINAGVSGVMQMDWIQSASCHYLPDLQEHSEILDVLSELVAFPLKTTLQEYYGDLGICIVTRAQHQRQCVRQKTQERVAPLLGVLYRLQLYWRNVKNGIQYTSQFTHSYNMSYKQGIETQVIVHRKKLQTASLTVEHWKPFLIGSPTFQILTEYSVFCKLLCISTGTAWANTSTKDQYFIRNDSFTSYITETQPLLILSPNIMIQQCGYNRIQPEQLPSKKDQEESPTNENNNAQYLLVRKLYLELIASIPFFTVKEGASNEQQFFPYWKSDAIKKYLASIMGYMKQYKLGPAEARDLVPITGVLDIYDIILHIKSANNHNVPQLVHNDRDIGNNKPNKNTNNSEDNLFTDTEDDDTDDDTRTNTNTNTDDTTRTNTSTNDHMNDKNTSYLVQSKKEDTNHITLNEIPSTTTIDTVSNTKTEDTTTSNTPNPTNTKNTPVIIKKSLYTRKVSSKPC